MNSEISLLQSLVPDIVKVIRQRYLVLEQIAAHPRIGRRTVASQLNLSERNVRTETEYLKKLALIDIKSSGMVLTDKGRQLLQELAPLIDRLLNASQLELALANRLGIERTMIVAGDSQHQSHVFDLLAQQLSAALDLLLPLGHSIITVLGGMTLSKLAAQLSPRLSHNRQLEFVPGRGALGEDVVTQSNTIVQQMSNACGGSYQNLYLPERVAPEAYHSLLRDPTIAKVLESISNSDAVIHGIGQAKEMAQRRNYDSMQLSKLHDEQAVTECFGCFFNRQGKIVERISRIGLQFEDLKHIPHIFAVAVGRQKAEAIQAYMHQAPHQTWLITDEATANQILKGK